MSTYIDSSKKINDDKIGDIVRISKYKNLFAKGYVQDCSEEAFMIKKVKNTVPWTYVISDLKGEEIFGITKNYSKKQIKKRLELKK